MSVIGSGRMLVKHFFPKPAWLALSTFERTGRTFPIVDPSPLWCWSLGTRATDERDSIAALREHAELAIRRAAPRAAPRGPTWLPAADPHRDTLRPSA